MNNICTAPVYKLEELNNIFIELTAKIATKDAKIAILTLAVKVLLNLLKTLFQ